MNSNDYRRNIESQVLIVIYERLKAGQMDARRAHELAEYILKVLPNSITVNEIYKTAHFLKDSFVELSGVSATVLNDYEEKVKDAVLPQIRELMKQGRFENATILLRRAIRHEVEIG